MRWLVTRDALFAKVSVLVFWDERVNHHKNNLHVHVCYLLHLQIEELKAELLKTQSSSKEYSSKLATYVKQLEEKDNKLKKLHSERHKHLEEVFEMK